MRGGFGHSLNAGFCQNVGRPLLRGSHSLPTCSSIGAPLSAVDGCRCSLFESQPLPVPPVGSATKDGDIPYAGGKQLYRCLGGSAIGLANQHDRLSPGSKFPDAARQISQRHVDSTGQVARRRSEFLGLTHIDEDYGIAGREAALQFVHLDPCRRLHAWPAEPTGQKCCHGELLPRETNGPQGTNYVLSECAQLLQGASGATHQPDV